MESTLIFLIYNIKYKNNFCIKTYFINIISPEAQEEYYCAMIGQLYQDLKLMYLDKNVAVVVNTFGWNTSVGNLIHEEISKIIRPDHRVELKGIDFKESLLLEDNTSQKAIEVLKSSMHFKGKKRRNRLLYQEIFDSNSGEAIIQEQLKFKGRLIEDKDLPNLHRILLNDKTDFYTCMKMQSSFEYNLSSVYLSADMTEYYLSDPSSFDDLSRIFQGSIVAICRISKVRIQEIAQFESSLEYNIRLSNLKDDNGIKFINFESIRSENIPAEVFAFGFAIEFDKENGIKIKHKNFKLDINHEKEIIAIILCDHLHSQLSYTEAIKGSYFQDDTNCCVFDKTDFKLNISSILDETLI